MRVAHLIELGVDLGDDGWGEKWIVGVGRFFTAFEIEALLVLVGHLAWVGRREACGE